VGIPVFDRLGAGHQVTIGYRGTRDLIFEIGNLFIAGMHEATPGTWMQPHHDPAAQQLPQ
jgi:nitrogenase molybdenum-iron protein NifN